jgi:hypothetical protein
MRDGVSARKLHEQKSGWQAHKIMEATNGGPAMRLPFVVESFEVSLKGRRKKRRFKVFSKPDRTW